MFAPWLATGPVLVAWTRDHRDCPAAATGCKFVRDPCRTGNAYGGNSTQARVLLDNPAPPAGAIVTIATDMPQVHMPGTTVTVPPEKPMRLLPITTGPVPNNFGGSVGIIGDLFAGFANGREQNSFGILPILYGTG